MTTYDNLSWWNQGWDSEPSYDSYQMQDDTSWNYDDYELQEWLVDIGYDFGYEEETFEEGSYMMEDGEMYDRDTDPAYSFMMFPRRKGSGKGHGKRKARDSECE